MAAGFEYFTSADAGAPVLNGAAGRLIAVLDWVLVAKGGWAKEFTGTNLAVYRSNTGNRFRLRVDDTQALYSRLRGYRSMTGVSTGTQPFPTTTQGTTTSWGVGKAYAAGAGARRYWGVRTNRYVVLFIEYASESIEGFGYNTINVMVFGDVPSLTEADAHNTILIGYEAGPTPWAYFPQGQCEPPSEAYPTGGGLAGNTQVAISGTPNGTVVSPSCRLIAPFGVNDNDDASYASARATAGRMYWAPYQVYSSNAVGTGTGLIPRCRVPNLQQMWGGAPAVANANAPCIYLESFSVAGRDFIAMQSYNAVSLNRWALTSLLERSDTDGAL